MRWARQFFRRFEGTIKIQGGRVVLAALVLGTWEIGSYSFLDPFFFSSPSRIARHVVREIVDISFYEDLYISALETGLGYFSGGFAGVVCGVVLARWYTLSQIIDPFLIALNSIPRIALAPLLMMWFGIDITSKVVLAATLVFFLTFFNTFSGIRAVEPAYSNIARVMGASDGQIFLKVLLPGASSWILTGLKMSLPFALIGAIVGEFMAASRGLGFRLNIYTATYNTTGAMTILLLMMVFMMFLNEVVNRIEAKILRWRPAAQIAQEPTEIR